MHALPRPMLLATASEGGHRRIVMVDMVVVVVVVAVVVVGVGVGVGVEKEQA